MIYILVSLVSAIIGFFIAALLSSAKRGDLLSEIQFLKHRINYLESIKENKNEDL